MSTQTTNLHLKKWDTTNPTDLNSNFDIETALNDNWDSIDEAVGDIQNDVAEINTALETKVDKITGKGLSTEDYTTAEKTKLSNIEANAEVNIIEDVKVNGISQGIVNKAVDISVPTKTSDIANDSGFIDKNVNDLVNYQLKITQNNKLNADLVDDTSSTNKFTNAQEKTAWNSKYNKPNTGIPKTDLANDVQASLGKADTALQEHQDITGKEDKSNKVTAINAQSTDVQYPSAKCVYDSQKSQDDKIAELQEENELLRKDISGLPTDTANGESIDITDSAEMRFEQFDVSGNSKQTQYSGKNKLPQNNGTEEISGVTFTKNSDGSITANGTSTAGINYYLNGYTWTDYNANTYTLSDGIGNGKSLTTYFTYFEVQNDNNIYLNSYDMPTRTYTSSFKARARIVIREDTTLNNVTFRVQIEERLNSNRIRTIHRRTTLTKSRLSTRNT